VTYAQHQPSRPQQSILNSSGKAAWLLFYKKILKFCEFKVSEPVVCSSQEASLGAIEILAKKKV